MIPTISLPILDTIEDILNKYLNEKAPHIPQEAKENIVKYIPYAVMLIMLAQIAAILAFFHVNTVFEGLGYLYATSEGVIGVIGIILLGGAIVLEGLALPLLFKHIRYGWKLLLYAVLISEINDMINLNIINLIFSGLLILYVLFQVRESYR